MYIKIQGTQEDLRSLAEELALKNIDIEPVFKRDIGFTNEPLLIAVIIALGGHKIIETIIELIKHTQKIKSQERIEIAKLKFQMLNDAYKEYKNISVDELLENLDRLNKIK